jgi:hypothetical protein
MNAEAALQLLLAQPADTEAVRRLLACIVKDAMRTGDIVDRTRYRRACTYQPAFLYRRRKKR